LAPYPFAFTLSQVYLFGSSWKPVTKLRTEVEMRVQEATDLAHPPAGGLAASASYGDIELSGNGHQKSAPANVLISTFLN